MKIAHVIPTYLPATRYGGPVRAVHDLCRYLVARGHQVEVFTTNVDGPGVVGIPTSAPSIVDGVTVAYFPVRAPRRIYYSPVLASTLERRIGEFDVLHLHSTFLYPTLSAARAAERNGIPYVISPRGMLVKELIRRKSFLLKSAWIALFERHTVERAAAVHVTSGLECEEIRRFGFAMPPVHVIPNGLERPAVEGAVSRVANRLLYLGRIDWKKGIERLISAVSLLADSHLVIAGNDDAGHTPKLLRLCERLGVSDRVRFIGPVAGSAKWRCYREASVFVLPSLSENLANTVLEAMAMECPVVVTPEVGLAEVVGKYRAGIVSHGEPAALADAIGAVLCDPLAARAMGTRGRQLVEEDFDWRELVVAMEQLYAGIAGRREQQNVA